MTIPLKIIGVAFLPAIALAAAIGAARAADPADCAGFGAKDAAPFLKAPAERVVRHIEKTGPGLWLCSYAVGKGAPGIAFSLEAAPDARRAAEALERYREDLVTASGVAPFKGHASQGAYSDIMGVGDEAVWTDINEVLTVRKASLTVQLTLPVGKLRN